MQGFFTLSLFRRFKVDLFAKEVANLHSANDPLILCNALLMLIVQIMLQLLSLVLISDSSRVDWFVDFGQLFATRLHHHEMRP